METIDIVLIGLKEGSFSDRLIKSIENTADMPFRIIKSFGGGIAENLNNGFKDVRSEIFGFFQDDWEFISDNWMSTLVNAFYDSSVNYVGGKQLLPDMKIHSAWLDISFKDGKYGVILKGNGLDRNNFTDTERKHCVPMFIRKDRFIEIGGHDEGFLGEQHEEPDICLRLGDPLYIGSVEYIHHFGENPETEKVKKLNLKHNLERLEKKYEDGVYRGQL